jgi:hypothetical protein
MNLEITLYNGDFVDVEIATNKELTVEYLNTCEATLKTKEAELKANKAEQA